MGGASPKDVLQSLIDEHGLDQRDLPEVAVNNHVKVY